MLLLLTDDSRTAYKLIMESIDQAVTDTPAPKSIDHTSNRERWGRNWKTCRGGWCRRPASKARARGKEDTAAGRNNQAMGKKRRRAQPVVGVVKSKS